MTSRILVTTNPTPCSDRMAASLPAPGPLINTSMWRIPESTPRRPACSAARCAAKAVPFLEPLNPTTPALADAITLPCGSVMLTKVLLKVEYMYARPCGTERRSRRLVLGLGISYTAYFLPPVRRPRPATVLRGPFRVRALVLVRCPETGRFRR